MKKKISPEYQHDTLLPIQLTSKSSIDKKLNLMSFRAA